MLNALFHNKYQEKDQQKQPVVLQSQMCSISCAPLIPARTDDKKEPF
jgi:hypothetical protein